MLKNICFSILLLLSFSGFCQAQSSYPQPQPPMPAQPYPQQPPPPQAPQQQPYGNPQPQSADQYAFRPNLSNPEYGECLQLEKNWKSLYFRYYQQYEQARLSGAAASYAPYLQSLKQQLDAAWNAFSSRCIYFPKQRKR